MTDTTQDVNHEAETQDVNAVTDQTQRSEQDSQPTGFEALPKETQDEIKRLRRENASYRTKVKSFEEANQTEAEKREAALAAAEERASTAESRYRKAVGRAAVAEEASKSGAISPKAIHALIQDAIEFDDEGSPTNVAALVEKLRTEEPALFRTPSADGGKGAPATSQDMNALIRRAAGRK